MHNVFLSQVSSQNHTSQDTSRYLAWGDLHLDITHAPVHVHGVLSQRWQSIERVFVSIFASSLESLSKCTAPTVSTRRYYRQNPICVLKGTTLTGFRLQKKWNTESHSHQNGKVPRDYWQKRIKGTPSKECVAVVNNNNNNCCCCWKWKPQTIRLYVNKERVGPFPLYLLISR